MREGGVPTADFEAFDDAASAMRLRGNRARDRWSSRRTGWRSEKASPFATIRRPLWKPSPRQWNGGASARRVIAWFVEEFLTGEEISFFALCDGENAIPLGTFQDHKAIFDGDRGPNTGGWARIRRCRNSARRLEARVMHEVVAPTLSAMNARGIPFRGLLYAD